MGESSIILDNVMRVRMVAAANVGEDMSVWEVGGSSAFRVLAGRKWGRGVVEVLLSRHFVSVNRRWIVVRTTRRFWGSWFVMLGSQSSA